MHTKPMLSEPDNSQPAYLCCSRVVLNGCIGELVDTALLQKVVELVVAPQPHLFQLSLVPCIHGYRPAAAMQGKALTPRHKALTPTHKAVTAIVAQSKVAFAQCSDISNDTHQSCSELTHFHANNEGVGARGIKKVELTWQVGFGEDSTRKGYALWKAVWRLR